MPNAFNANNYWNAHAYAYSRMEDMTGEVARMI